MIGIQRKIWTLTAMIMFIMLMIWITLMYYNQKTENQYNEILQRYLRLNEVTTSSQQVVTSLNSYLITPAEGNLSSLRRKEEMLRSAQLDISNLRNSENDFALTGYINLIDSLIETSERAVMFHSEKESEDSADAFAEATRISKYISDMTLTLLDKELSTYEQFYRGIIEQSAELKKLGIWILVTMTFWLLLFTYWFSLSITRPIQQLTRAAQELAKGRFDLQVRVNSSDEISFLAKMFEHMRISINGLISEIQQKAQLENELQRNKLLLQESQLRSLQSQINPHFLFNILDTLSKKAFLEGAEETSDLLVSVAGLLRYNLKRLDRSVTLYEEVRVMKQYMEIQKARFTDRLRLYTDIDEECLSIQMPGLTLQPIIENAINHAVEPDEHGGTIEMIVHDQGEHVIIEIADDGPGMSSDKIEQILNEQPLENEGHSTGIGFTNVVQRLRLFYGVHDVIDINSAEGAGVRVRLTIPKTRRIDAYDEAAYR
ncbi:sensor histidine kinase [Paenibacillus hunanensis]|uniref:sensor histidine kinase n=1 Tax=Paenibacillus hunanensis TaxID=539262 RepID=UPI00202628B5|nr:sensor histidine kinase [Paenibacillus hunanensis]MCL9659706.1 sensor histidine kinase [Paenibacillus hunanensis]WPP39373.1 sensor histidine kinase [Paenibacillus hunanensis]